MLYKQKYIIALYDDDDEMLTVTSNAEELADYIGKPLQQVYVMLQRAYHRKSKTVTTKFRNNMITIYLIRDSENERYGKHKEQQANA